jgi:thymidylate kinase
VAALDGLAVSSVEELVERVTARLAGRECVLCLLGPHGAGKTTLGRALAEHLGWPFDDEIGRRLREEALERDPYAHALLPQASFDERVVAAELARDEAGVCPRIVETWHPGNLAYAAHRSQETYAALESRVRGTVSRLRDRVVVQPLTMSRRVALQRLSEPGPSRLELVTFFMAVAESARRQSKEWGIEVWPALSTNANRGESTSPIRPRTAARHGNAGQLPPV